MTAPLRVSQLLKRATLAVMTLLVVVAPSRVVSSPVADDTLSSVRSRGVVRCASIIRPGIAVPTVDGKHWYGIAPDVCRAIAAAIFADPARMTFRPYFNGKRLDGTTDTLDDVVFVSGAQLVGTAAPPAQHLVLGPVILHDALSVLVPATGARAMAELAKRSVCAEPGSPADRALTRYFLSHDLTLHEHPFQEVDEMRQAYSDGKCDALAGPLTTLGSVRADPQDGRRTDRILSERLADDPIMASTPGDARWARIIWWTFSVLVDAEVAGIDRSTANRDTAIPGVPPAVATDLGLTRDWDFNALEAVGNYREVFERNLGSNSRFALMRAENAVWSNGGRIFGLSAE
jgi:general L-amino acid transport system substrate-binding protein